MAAMEQLVRVKSTQCGKITSQSRQSCGSGALQSKRAQAATRLSAALAAIVKKADGAQLNVTFHTPGSYVVQQILSEPIENRGDYWPGQIEVNAWDQPMPAPRPPSMLLLVANR